MRINQETVYEYRVWLLTPILVYNQVIKMTKSASAWIEMGRYTTYTVSQPAVGLCWDVCTMLAFGETVHEDCERRLQFQGYPVEEAGFGCTLNVSYNICLFNIHILTQIALHPRRLRALD